MTSVGQSPGIRLVLAGSKAVLTPALLLVSAAFIAALNSTMSMFIKILLLAYLGVAAAHCLPLLRHGRSKVALRELQWQGGDRWTLRRGDGRCSQGRLDRRSRRIGQATLLVFRRGVFGRFDRPWVLVLPHMVNDPSALRRLRMRLTLDARRMCGLTEP